MRNIRRESNFDDNLRNYRRLKRGLQNVIKRQSKVLKYFSYFNIHNNQLDSVPILIFVKLRTSTYEGQQVYFEELRARAAICTCGFAPREILASTPVCIMHVTHVSNKSMMRLFLDTVKRGANDARDR